LASASRQRGLKLLGLDRVEIEVPTLSSYLGAKAAPGGEEGSK